MKLQATYSTSTIGAYIHWVPIFVWVPINWKQYCTGCMGASSIHGCLFCMGALIIRYTIWVYLVITLYVPYTLAEKINIITRYLKQNSTCFSANEPNTIQSESVTREIRINGKRCCTGCVGASSIHECLFCMGALIIRYTV